MKVNDFGSHSGYAAAVVGVGTAAEGAPFAEVSPNNPVVRGSTAPSKACGWLATDGGGGGAPRRPAFGTPGAGDTRMEVEFSCCTHIIRENG